MKKFISYITLVVCVSFFFQSPSTAGSLRKEWRKQKKFIKASLSKKEAKKMKFNEGLGKCLDEYEGLRKLMVYFDKHKSDLKKLNKKKKIKKLLKGSLRNQGSACKALKKASFETHKKCGALMQGYLVQYSSREHEDREVIKKNYKKIDKWYDRCCGLHAPSISITCPP